MDDELEAVPTAEADRAEVSDVTGRDPMDAELLGERNHRSVHKPELEVAVLLVDLDGSGQRGQSRRGIEERPACELSDQPRHRGSLAAEKVLDLGEHETGDIPCA